MIFRQFVIKSEKLITDNSPLILTAIGATGVVATALLAGKASFRAAELIAEEHEKRGVTKPVHMHVNRLTKKDKFELLWKLYIPAVSSGVLSCTAIIMANRISTRRAAAMAAMYALSENRLAEYKDKVAEKIGLTKEQKVRDEIAQDRVSKNPPRDGQVIITGNGDSLFYDEYSGRYFLSTMEEVKKAANNVNHVVINNGYASLNELYNWLGLNNIPLGEEVGWTSDDLLDPTFSTTVSEDEKPCFVLAFRMNPVRHYDKVHGR